MTESEAIEWQKSFKKTYKSFPKDVDDACDMAINALEKQIPKKPKDRYKTRYIWDSAYCPVCDCGITARWVYCQCCGQKLDFGE